MKIKEVFKNPEQLDFVKWMRIVNKEIDNQSDRALVLLCASILDKQLEDILKEFLIEDNKRDKNLFGSNSSFSTFSSKLNACYYMGLLSKHEYSCIDTIRKIRNEFAHKISINSFYDSQQIIDWCKNLSIPYGMYVPDMLIFDKRGVKEFPDNPFTNDTPPKERFIITFKYLTQYLNTRCYEANALKREVFVPKTQYELLLEARTTLDKLCKEQVSLLEKSIELLEEKKTLLSKAGVFFDEKDQTNLDNCKEMLNNLKANSFVAFSDDLTVSPDEYISIYDKLLSALKLSKD